MISLGGGLPNPSLFPLKELSFTVQRVGGDPVAHKMDGALLSQALQYSNSYGMPSLLSHWRKLLAREHKSHPYQHGREGELAILVTTGSQDGLSKCFDLLLDPNDALLVENPTYWCVSAFPSPAPSF